MQLDRRRQHVNRADRLIGALRYPRSKCLGQRTRFLFLGIAQGVQVHRSHHTKKKESDQRSEQSRAACTIRLEFHG